ncbi:hypothetical protein D3C73_1142600 [compost metagenome]
MLYVICEAIPTLFFFILQGFFRLNVDTSQFVHAATRQGFFATKFQKADNPYSEWRTIVTKMVIGNDRPASRFH